MTLRTCRWEAEVKRSLALGHWPQSTTEELRAHIAGCRACGDLVLLAQSFGQARAVSAAAAVPPPASVLWWRAQLRRRDEAVRRMQRPLVGAQVFAFAVAVALMIGTLAYQAMHGMPWAVSMGEWLTAAQRWQGFHLGALWPSEGTQAGASLMYLVPGAAMLLLLGGVVVYLATEKQ